MNKNIKSTTTVTFHGVLAGCYEGGRKNLKALLTHAALDGSDSALCGRVRAHGLCDEQEPALTCPVCRRRLVGLAKKALKNAA